MKLPIVIVVGCVLALKTVASYEVGPVPDDENHCKYNDGGFTCSCPYGERPSLVYSQWNEETGKRRFTQRCEKTKTVKVDDKNIEVYLGTKSGADEWEFECPDGNFYHTWGAFEPLENDHQIRLWYHCSPMDCVNIQCMWTPNTEYRKDFPVDLNTDGLELLASGAGGIYSAEKRDSSWKLKMCFCMDQKQEL